MVRGGFNKLHGYEIIYLHVVTRAARGHLWHFSFSHQSSHRNIPLTGRGNRSRYRHRYKRFRRRTCTCSSPRHHNLGAMSCLYVNVGGETLIEGMCIYIVRTFITAQPKKKTLMEVKYSLDQGFAAVRAPTWLLCTLCYVMTAKCLLIRSWWRSWIVYSQVTFWRPGIWLWIQIS